jgi:outer membrane lipoprotein carrier protein
VKYALAVSLIALTSVATLPQSAPSIARAIEARYNHASKLKAAFYEQYSDGKGGGSAESGIVYFSKPGRMRWEYESPEQKLFIVDGTNVWFYIPADHTASRAKIGESSDWRTPLAFLTGKTNLTRLCRNIEIVGPKSKGSSSENPTQPENTVLRCIPRVDSGDAGEQIRDVLLEADPEARLVRIVIQQPGNLTTEFRFKDWEENPSVPEIKFHFIPPAGVTIVEESDIAQMLR